jgi:hypothetical protein
MACGTCCLIAKKREWRIGENAPFIPLGEGPAIAERKRELNAKTDISTVVSRMLLAE